jgi:ATP-binding cassette subfamily B protein
MARMQRNKFGQFNADLAKARGYIRYANQLYPHVFGIQLCASVISTISIFVNIFFIGQIINLLVRADDQPIVIWRTVGFLLILLVLNLISEYFKVRANSGAHLILAHARRNMATKMLDADYPTFIDPAFRKLYSTVKTGFTYTGGFTVFVANILNGLISFGTTCVLAAGSLVVMIFAHATTHDSLGNFVNSPWFILVVIGLVVIPLLSSRPITTARSQIMKQFFAYNIQFNRVLDYYGEILFKTPIFGKTLRLYDLTGKTVRKAREDVYQQIKKDADFQVRVAQVASMNTLITYGVVGLLYLLVSMKSATGAIGVGSVVVYVGYLQQLMATLATVFSAWGQRESSFKTMDQYIQFMNFGDTTDDSGKRPLPDLGTDCQIEFSHVSYRYPGSDRWALNDINLTIHKGERLAIVGPNGSGKTTLVKLLVKLIQPTSGTIKINGVNIDDLSVADYQALFSVVFQDFSLSSFSVNDNVSSAPTLNAARAKRSLKLAGVWEKIASLPHQGETAIGTQLDANGVQFSGGELQKIAIARAWYKDAPIIVLDEPTAALDPISEAEIYAHFNELVANKTAVYISHRMSSTRFSSRILVLNHSAIVESGTHATLMAQHGLYYNLFSQQAKYYQ